MFVAPLVIPASLEAGRETRRVRARPRVAVRTAEATTVAPLFLLAWLASGLLLLACVRAARGNGLLGATLPFWLVGAPLLDLAWLWRARQARMLARACGAARRLLVRRGARSR